MPALYQAVITDKGLNLRAKAEAGKYGIEFTKAVTGSGEYDGSEDLQTMVHLKEPVQEFGFSKREYIDDATSMLRVIVTNTGLEEGYYVREIGVFAQDPDEGEILYSLSLAADNKWDYLPEYEWGAAIIELEIETAVSNAKKVTIKAKMDALATADDVNELREPEFQDYSNQNEVPGVSEAIQMIKSEEQLTVLMQYIKASLMGMLEFADKLENEKVDMETYLEFCGKMERYSPFVTMYQNIPVSERAEDKWYLLVTDTKGVPIHYCNQYVLMGEDIPLEEREESVLYGSETEAKSGLEPFEKPAIMRILNFESLESREIPEGSIREQDIFYFYETEEKIVWQE